MIRLNLFFASALFLITGSSNFAQVIYRDGPPYSDSSLIQDLYRNALQVQDSLYALDFPAHTLDILETDNGKFLVVDGRLHLYRWEEGQWNNISNSKYHGHNFRSKKFVWNGQVYSYGGYGFWREHGGMIFFDWTHHEWESAVMLSDYDPGHNVGFLQDSFLMVLNPTARNQLFDQVEKHSGLYQINLNSRSVEVFEINPALEDLRFASRIETENFYLPSHDPFQIIDKRRLMYKFSDLTYLRSLTAHTSRSLFYIHGDTLTLQFNDTSDWVEHYDLNALYNQVSTVEKPILKKARIPYSIPAILVLIAGSAAWYVKRRRSIPTARKFKHPLIERLLEYSGQELSQEELDVVFGIDQINPAETQRSKRSSMFKDINEEYQAACGKKLIERVPDPMDRRKFRYPINGD